MCLGSISGGDRSAALGASWWLRSFSLAGRWLQCHHHAAPWCILPPKREWTCKKGRQADRRVSGQLGSGAEPGEGAARKMPTQRQETSQTDIPLHLNFPGELYLNEASESNSVKANSRRTEQYFNHDTKHWFAFPVWHSASEMILFLSVRLLRLCMLIRSMKATFSFNYFPATGSIQSLSPRRFFFYGDAL